MYLSVNLLRDVQALATRRVCMWLSGYVLPARGDGAGGCRDSVQKSSANEEISKTATGTFSNDTRQYHRELKRGYYKSRALRCRRSIGRDGNLQLTAFNKERRYLQRESSRRNPTFVPCLMIISSPIDYVIKFLYKFGNI